MSTTTLAVDQSNTECPYEATYTNSITKSNNNDILPQEMLISSNCHYILIRQPSTILSFYSISDSHLINKWPINSNIWSINDEHFHNTDSITISNSGCLTFTYQSKNASQICIENNLIPTTTMPTTTEQLPNNDNAELMSLNNDNAELMSLNGNNTIEKIEANLAIIIPSTICFIGIFCIIIFLLWNRFRKRKYNHIHNDNVGGETHSIESLTDTNEESDNGNIIVNIEFDSTDNEEDGYIETEDNEIDLSDCRPMSNDVYPALQLSHENSDRLVTQRVISIATPMNILTRNKSLSTSTDFYDSTELIVPTMLLNASVGSGSGTSETDSDLDMSIHIDNTQSGLMKTKISQRLSDIKECENDDDNIIIRDNSIDDDSNHDA